MERSNSTSSRPASSASPFAYQTRLLERTSSSASTLSRNNSRSGAANILTSNPTGSTSSPRRWTPSHRFSTSVDNVRGQWEERSRENSGDGHDQPPSASRDDIKSPSFGRLQSAVDSPTSQPSTRTPTYIKRQTMPTPIIASPLSPNVTGVSVESDSSSSATPRRIHLPSPSYDRFSHRIPADPPTESSSPPRVRRNTFDFDTLKRTTPLRRTESPTRSSIDTFSNATPKTIPVLNRLPTSPTTPTSSYRISPTKGLIDPTPQSPTHAMPPTSPPSSVMFPQSYKSSYMNDKANKYGPTLTAGRRLGRHLPRIASGDRDENWNPEEEEKPHVMPEGHKSYKSESVRQRRARRQQQRLQDIVIPDAEGDGVAGIPGRLRLSKDRVPASPVPSSKLTRGLWADTHRHFIQAYEYLCHVGEAQQWIEGCLGEELEFGVVEMEEGLRNGVALARLVRVFKGEGFVKKIYDAPKLDFRHSDNINIFFTFVRDVGLPECFIFETTDLYNKKNIPKVIYCIHALSHLLARRGLAERIGNLVGRLQFSDDQLQRTQKGLKDSGVSMPNFGNIGRELAKEINEEPEVEPETEDERRDRLLLENEGSIVALQAHLRGVLMRQEQAALQARMRLTERNIPKVQAYCRGVLARRKQSQQRQARDDLRPWVLALQALARGALARRRWQHHVRQIRRSKQFVISLQAQIRGVLQRRKFQRLKAALRTSQVSVLKLQSVARARLSRQTHQELTRTFARPILQMSVNAVQAHCRGVLARRKFDRQASLLHNHSHTFNALQAHCRGVMVRRRMRKQMAKLEDVSQTIVRIQAAARTYLARKRLLNIIRGLRKATPAVVNFQALARARLAVQKRHNLHKSLAHVHTASSVNNVQTLARAFLARKQHQELSRKLDFVAPDVVGLQATIRGLLVRDMYFAWRDHLHNNVHVATLLQAMLRGTIQRRKFRAKMEYYRANLNKVVKIQSLFRAKEQREQYRQLTLGKNVTVGTIKNFVHLLDDSEADFKEEIKVEELRQKVVEGIRKNQELENDASNLHTQIGMVVQNVKDVKSLHRRHDAASITARNNLLAAHGDPFSSNLDQTARRKLELYQQLFHLLQTRPEYLSRLFRRLSSDKGPETDKRFTERVVLTIFGYGQDLREDYLLLRLFQSAIYDEFSLVSNIEQVIANHPMHMNIALHYVRSKQVAYARDAFQAIIRKIVDDSELDLEVDPTKIHRKRLEIEEIRNNAATSRNKDLPFHEALNDPDTRALYIRHLQNLQWRTEEFITAIVQSTRKMPYNMRYLARETLIRAREMFPNLPPEKYAACVGRIVFYRYINPAIMAPETFDIVQGTISNESRTNLAQISHVLTQITAGVEFNDHNYIAINEFIVREISRLSAWLLEVADIPDADTQFHAHEFLDATVPPKPIYISPNEIYTMHGLLVKYMNDLAPHAEDPLKAIIGELDGVPHFGSEELKDARDIPITLELSNRFASVEDPHAAEKALWVQAKRGVLAILRVQPAQDLLASLLRPVTDEDETVWEDIVEAEMENEHHTQQRFHGRQASSAVPDSAYRLEDIRSLTFRQVKASAISHLLELEKQGKVARDDGFQGILNAIANDVRSKHRKRLQRQQQMQSMNEALKDLDERRKYFEELIDTYANFRNQSMETMQKGKAKKRLVVPFTRQFFHQRELQKSGQTPEFGSYIYTAKDLYDRGILLSIDDYSPRQFDKLHITMSSEKAGIFTITLNSLVIGGVPTKIASENIRIQDLLQGRYEQLASLSVFNGKATFHFESFLNQINKKFYA